MLITYFLLLLIMDILFKMFDSGMANLPYQKVWIILHTLFPSNIYPSDVWQIVVFFYHEAFRVDFILFYLGDSVS